MSVIQGKNVIFSLVGWFEGSLFSDRVIACARSCTLTTATSLIETTTKGSGKGATFTPQKNVTTGSIEGLIFINEKKKVTLPLLRQLQLGHALQHGVYERIADDGSSYKDVFDFYITNITDTGSVGDFNTFQMDIQVNGDPRIIVTETVAPQRMVEWQFSVSDPTKSSKGILSFSQPHGMNEDIVIPLNNFPFDSYVLIKYPADEGLYTKWYNSPFNNGTIPDSVFEDIYTIGDWKYIKTRTGVSFDTTAPLKITH